MVYIVQTELPNLMAYKTVLSGVQKLPNLWYPRSFSADNLFAMQNKKNVIPKVSSVGEDLTYLERDRSITTDPTESKKRRTIKLIRTNSSWGFTLQTYGIRHKKNNEIEITTYVDYVEIDKPAWIAGMRQGDVILSVNGDSVEQATHQQLVEKIKSCARYMRLVVLFEDCCRKVELHDRYIKLKNILREKKRELKLLNEQEQNILQDKQQVQKEDVEDNK
ncbi:general receptor for phosphoinositides 1-associated scaffold protein isoform X5 [Octopus bimaculoides]|uniref:general receptor for phosphoinositides 1-associated scaffold protein isoform X5 n=1 Tax=Octopus bimaculoides TaxID=37653 RepID=UPI00071C4018|nr:general receptor for phosphoinositides 1-associated scaffold protein isoform X5 [Octopus bimaculoides]|eukprot:XP_014785417.1 PREDICTED: general receptor for phosphoinositides 1-associated scaffold protein-like isoform X3 [Octopus bimaculoides]